MYYERTIEPVIKKITETFPVLIVTGPRQVGKTTLLTRMAQKDRKIVSLDNPTIRAFAKSDPELFIQRYAPPVLIDEVQYAPELFDYIKIYVDREKRCGDFWLTGSQTFRMMKHVTESLAGRAGIVQMLGLSSSEVRGLHFSPFRVDVPELMRRMAQTAPMTLPEIFERIFRGSMPRLYENPDVDRAQYYESYLETYISRDIKDLSQVADETAFLNFMSAAAARTATNVNYEALANEIGISAPTAKHWLSVLVSSGIIALIQPYSNNALKRVIKAPRMYFLDTGLCAHLTRWSSAEVLESGAMNGAVLENYVVSEIAKTYMNSRREPYMYYYRDKDAREIDIVLEHDGVLNPIEIKKTSNPGTELTRVFRLLDKASVPRGKGAVVCMKPGVGAIDRDNYIVPVWTI